MSYDFYLFEVKPEEKALEKIEYIFQQLESEPVDTGEPIQSKEERKEMLKSALIERNSQLEKFEFDYDKISKYEGITIEQAKRRYRHFELNGPEDSNGIQITLNDDMATITVPYWHKGDKAKEVFSEIWDYLSVIQDKVGYEIYDPQIERILNLSTDFEESLSSYTTVVSHLETDIYESINKKKPWWKFWV